jgi:hypothetical protein
MNLLRPRKWEGWKMVVRKACPNGTNILDTLGQWGVPMAHGVGDEEVCGM